MILNVDNEVHLFCLHYIYIPRINCALSQFLLAWNNHPLSSVGNLSPIQLWIADSSRSSAYEDVTEVGEIIWMLYYY